jgi:hypothetical protein
MATTGKASIMMSALGDYSDIMMLAPSGGQAEIKAGAVSSQVRVSSPHDKGISIESTPETAKLTGIGTTFFGLGDSGFPVQGTPAPAAPAPKP